MKDRSLKILDIVPPFDFDLSARVFSREDKQIQTYSDGEYSRVLRIGDKLLLASIRSMGTVDEPKLLVKLKSDAEISRRDKTVAQKLISTIFDLKLDLKPFYQTVAVDKVMLKLVERLKGLKAVATPTAFEALISSILAQQISLNVAFNMRRKLIKKFGDVLTIDLDKYYAFPMPERLSIATINEFRACGLSTRKAEYVKGVSKLLASGELKLEDLKSMDEETILRELCKIKGIGRWTAELTMVRGMHKHNVLPADDLGLRRCVAEYYTGGMPVSGDEARAVAEKWKPWRGYASFYLIAAERLGIKA
jgi:DNA-3-methyladenine glycosylase II